MNLPVRTVRLALNPHEAGLFCGSAGLTLNGYPLLEETNSGFAPRTLPELQSIFDASYGTSLDLEAGNYLPGLAKIARSLSAGNLPLAMISSLLLKLPDAPSDLGKCGQNAYFERKLAFDNAQPRDADGRWTQGAGEARRTPPVRLEPPETSPATNLAGEAAAGVKERPIVRLGIRTLGLIGRFALTIADAVPLAIGMILIPTNKSNIHSGDIPGFPGLRYYSDEGIVTLSRRDAAGQVQDIYRGLPIQMDFIAISTAILSVATSITAFCSTTMRFRSLRRGRKRPRR